MTSWYRASGIYMATTASGPSEVDDNQHNSKQLRGNVLYVVDALPTPPDSEEWPRSYIRGCDGLTEAVDTIGHRTGGAVAYLGEWHSHPDGTTCQPSPDDLVFLAWLTDHMFVDGMPGLKAIVGEGDDVSWYTTTLTSVEDL